MVQVAGMCGRRSRSKASLAQAAFAGPRAARARRPSSTAPAPRACCPTSAASSSGSSASRRGIVRPAYGPGLYFVGPGRRPCTRSRARSTSSRRPTTASEALRKGGPGAGASPSRGPYFDRRAGCWARPRTGRSTPSTSRPPTATRSAADVTLLYSIADPVQDRQGLRLGLALRGRLRDQHVPERRSRQPGQDERGVLLRRGRADPGRPRGRGAAAPAVRGARLQGREAAAPQLPLRGQLREVAATPRRWRCSSPRRTARRAWSTRRRPSSSRSSRRATPPSPSPSPRSRRRSPRSAPRPSSTRPRPGPGRTRRSTWPPAEAKRLKADALTQAGGRYVVALETAKMFDNIDGAVMTPEQYIAFVRNAWAPHRREPGSGAPAPAGEKK